MDSDDINAMSSTCLEISRASTLMRGLLTVLGISGLFLYIWMLIHLASLLFPIDADTRPLLWTFPVALIIATMTVFLALKMDLGLSRDRPVRFNRENGRVYVYEHNFTLNPLAAWPIAIKEFEWSTLEAELHKQVGFNGRIYMRRFSLWLVSYGPGTQDPVDRFELKGNSVTTKELYDTWDYCRQYMEHGPQELPEFVPRSAEPSFRRSFFEYFRFLDPTSDGRDLRRQMSISDWAFNISIFILGFWIFIPMGIGHYISMRIAPQGRWPEEM